MKYSLVTLLVLSFGSSLSAAPILITQTFGPALSQMNVNGTLQTVTGNWVFKIETDTTNPDLAASGTFGVFATSSITASNTGLGLVDVAVISHLFYFELLGTSSGIGTVNLSERTNISAFSGAALGDPNIIESSNLDFGPSTAGAEWLGFSSSSPLVFANGTEIRNALSFDNSVSFQTSSSTSAVPEPSTFALLGMGAIGLMGYRRRKRKQVA